MSSVLAIYEIVLSHPGDIQSISSIEIYDNGCDENLAMGCVLQANDMLPLALNDVFGIRFSLGPSILSQRSIRRNAVLGWNA